MRQAVKPGGTLEIPTLEEIVGILGGLLGGPSESAPAIRASMNKACDASGNLILPDIYTVPAGMAFRLTRLYVADDAHTFANPFSATGAALMVLQDGSVVDGQPLTGSGGGYLPAVYTEGLTSALYYTNGQKVGVQLVGTATLANVNVTVRMQGELIDLPNR